MHARVLIFINFSNYLGERVPAICVDWKKCEGEEILKVIAIKVCFFHNKKLILTNCISHCASNFKSLCRPPSWIFISIVGYA